MLIRLLKADLKRGFIVALTLAGLIGLAAMLTTASTALIVDTLAATSRLQERSKVPDLIQMHAGNINDQDRKAIDDWVSTRSDITAYDVLKTLPAPRQDLWIAGENQAEAYHEPAFVTPPKTIDLLLDENDNSVDPAPGQIALPIHYQVVGMAKVGDTVTVDTGDWRIDLKVIGFVRDAQMNAAMIPSKRLVVNQTDFAVLEQHILEPEFLVEFTLVEDTRATTVIDDYKEAGLPSTGININSSLQRLMNSVSTLLIAAVALVVALVLMVVAMLALRYTVLAAIESDLPRIAVLKAIGAPQSRIRHLYLLKYLVLALIGAVIGYLTGLPLAAALGAPTMRYLGNPPITIWSIGIPITTVIALTAAIIGITWAVLHRVGKISAIEALRSGTSGNLKNQKYRWQLTSVRRLPVQQWLGIREALRPNNALLLGVLALCTFTMALPTNVSTTLADPQIATYLGSGQADLRIDVRAGAHDLNVVENTLTADDRISEQTTILRRDYKMQTPTGEWESVLIDIGNHTIFPMQYITGVAPTKENEISLSYNQAKAVEAEVGSTVTVHTTAGDREMLVTGTYQDITNNGLTAKALFEDDTPAIWQIIYADLQNPEEEITVTSDLSKKLPGVQITGVSEYASQFFGATNTQIQLIAILTCGIALGLAFLITVLFTVLVLSRERMQVGTLRALGCTTRAIGGQYLTRFGVLTIVGLILGLALVTTVGEAAVGLVLGTRGTPKVELLPNLWLIGVIIPTALTITILGAVCLALRRLATMTLTTSE